MKVVGSWSKSSSPLAMSRDGVSVAAFRLLLRDILRQSRTILQYARDLI